MFHVKHKAFAFAFGLLVLTAVGCSPVAKPGGWSAPVVADELILIQSNRGEITALRQIPGAQPAVAWKYPGDDERVDRGDLQAIYATPIVHEQAVYLAAYSGDLIALDLEYGRPLSSWPSRVRIAGNVVATPAFDGKMLYVPDEHGRVHPVDAANGAVGQPLLDADERVWGRPALDAGSLYVGALDQRMRAVDIASRSPKWQRGLGSAFAGDVVIEGDTVFAGTLESELYALNAADGGTRWRFEGDGWFWARPVVADDTVYAATISGSVYALDRANGAQRWRFREGDTEIRGAPVLVGDLLVVATRDGKIYGLDRKSGALRWTTAREGSRFLADPLVLESDVLLVSTSGELVRVRPRDGGAADLLYRRN